MKLPNSFFAYPQLHSLNLTHNRITELSYSIGFNELDFLANEIKELVNLKILIVVHDKMQILPPNMGNLKSLDTLRLFNNHSKTIPSSLSKYKSLNTFQIVMNKNLNEDMKDVFEKKRTKPFVDRCFYNEWETTFFKDCMDIINLFAKMLKATRTEVGTFF
ncbi:hypothetical protein QTN25_003715 [Entamoeba marina]